MSINTTTHDNGNTHHVVETWNEDTEWYRVWSDGWIEQGGFIANGTSAGSRVINLNKVFSDTDYVVFCITLSTYTGTPQNSNFLTVCNKTISSFTTGVPTNSVYDQGKNWYACGY